MVSNHSLPMMPSLWMYQWEKMGYWEVSQSTVIEHSIIFENNLRMILREKINLITATYLLDCNLSPERSRKRNVTRGATDKITFVPYQYLTLSFVSNLVSIRAQKYFLAWHIRPPGRELTGMPEFVPDNSWRQHDLQNHKNTIKHHLLLTWLYAAAQASVSEEIQMKGIIYFKTKRST